MEADARAALHRALTALHNHGKCVNSWGTFESWQRDPGRVAEEKTLWEDSVKTLLEKVPDCLAKGKRKPDGPETTLWSTAITTGIPAVLERVLKRTVETCEMSSATFERIKAFENKKHATGKLSDLVHRQMLAAIAQSSADRSRVPLRSLAPGARGGAPPRHVARGRTGAGSGAGAGASAGTGAGGGAGAERSAGAEVGGTCAVLIPSPERAQVQHAADNLCKLVSDGNLLILLDFFKSAARDAVLARHPTWLDYPCSGEPKESALMLAVRGNKMDIIDALLDTGANPNTPGQSPSTLATPLAVALASTAFDGTAIAKALLAMGADPQVRVPAGAVGNTEESAPYELAGDNLSMKYWLRVAMRQPPMSEGQKAFLRRLGLQRLPMIDFSLVGQDAAKASIKQQLVAFFSNLGAAKGKPLVILMPGPPGHGKTALVRDGIARVLQGMRGRAEAPFAMVACEQVAEKRGMFGSEVGLTGSDKQGALQAACSRGGEGRDEDLGLSGQPAVILLDEIDKCSAETLRTFYGVFEDGKLRDSAAASGNRNIDCSAHAFMLTCNWAQSVCNEFEPQFQELATRCKPDDSMFTSLEPEVVSRRLQLQKQHEDGMQRILAVLEARVRDRVRSELRKGRADALVGRMSAVVPFVAFTEEERLVVVDSFLREYCALVRKTPEQRNLASLTGKDLLSSMYVGNLDLTVEGGVRETLAEQYRPGDGMRSIRNAVLAATSVALLRGIGTNTVRLGDNGVVDCTGGLQRAALTVVALDHEVKSIVLKPVS